MKNLTRIIYNLTALLFLIFLTYLFLYGMDIGEREWVWLNREKVIHEQTFLYYSVYGLLFFYSISIYFLSRSNIYENELLRYGAIQKLRWQIVWGLMGIMLSYTFLGWVVMDHIFVKLSELSPFFQVVFILIFMLTTRANNYLVFFILGFSVGIFELYGSREAFDFGASPAALWTIFTLVRKKEAKTKKTVTYKDCYVMNKIRGRNGQFQLCWDLKQQVVKGFKTSLVPAEDYPKVLSEIFVALTIPQHPGLSGINGVVFKHNRFIMEMNIASGRSLGDVFRNVSRDKMLKEKYMIIKQIAETMVHLEEYYSSTTELKSLFGISSFFHGDLHPENIQITFQGAPVLLDWGASLRSNRRGKTFPTMAPELLEGSKVPLTSKIDVFSLGAIMWFLFVGEAPFDKGPLHSKEEKSDNYVDVALIEKQVFNKPEVTPPRSFLGFIKKTLAYEPQYRPGFREIVSEIEGYIGTGNIRKHYEHFPSDKKRLSSYEKGNLLIDFSMAEEFREYLTKQQRAALLDSGLMLKASLKQHQLYNSSLREGKLISNEISLARKYFDANFPLEQHSKLKLETLSPLSVKFTANQCVLALGNGDLQAVRKVFDDSKANNYSNSSMEQIADELLLIASRKRLSKQETGNAEDALSEKYALEVWRLFWEWDDYGVKIPSQTIGFFINDKWAVTASFAFELHNILEELYRECESRLDEATATFLVAGLFRIKINLESSDAEKYLNDFLPYMLKVTDIVLQKESPDYIVKNLAQFCNNAGFWMYEQNSFNESHWRMLFEICEKIVSSKNVPNDIEIYEYLTKVFVLSIKTLCEKSPSILDSPSSESLRNAEIIWLGYQAVGSLLNTDFFRLVICIGDKLDAFGKLSLLYSLRNFDKNICLWPISRDEVKDILSRISASPKIRDLIDCFEISRYGEKEEIGKIESIYRKQKNTREVNYKVCIVRNYTRFLERHEMLDESLNLLGSIDLEHKQLHPGFKCHIHMARADLCRRLNLEERMNNEIISGSFYANQMMSFREQAFWVNLAMNLPRMAISQSVKPNLRMVAELTNNLLLFEEWKEIYKVERGDTWPQFESLVDVDLQFVHGSVLSVGKQFELDGE